MTEQLQFAPAVRAGDMVFCSGVIAALQDGEAASDEAYFRATPDPERGFALAALTDSLSFTNASWNSFPVDSGSDSLFVWTLLAPV